MHHEGRSRMEDSRSAKRARLEQLEQATPEPSITTTAVALPASAASSSSSIPASSQLSRQPSCMDESLVAVRKGGPESLHFKIFSTKSFLPELELPSECTHTGGLPTNFKAGKILGVHRKTEKSGAGSQSSLDDPDFVSLCELCGPQAKGTKHDTMVCLHCSTSLCGQFSAKKHMLEHHQVDQKHCIVMSMADGSFWCYRCNEYLETPFYPELKPFYREFYRQKFGERPPQDPSPVPPPVVTSVSHVAQSSAQGVGSSWSSTAVSGWNSDSSSGSSTGASASADSHIARGVLHRDAISAGQNDNLDYANYNNNNITIAPKTPAVPSPVTLQPHPGPPIPAACSHCAKLSPHGFSGTDPFKAQTCSVCDDDSELWVCLHCEKVFCGRFAKRHGVIHWMNTKHCVLMSLSDGTIWCYLCREYQHHDASSVLSSFYAAFHMARHGEAPPMKSLMRQNSLLSSDTLNGDELAMLSAFDAEQFRWNVWNSSQGSASAKGDGGSA